MFSQIKITPWQARKGRKEYSFRRCDVKIIQTQYLRIRVWITFFDRYRLPLLLSQTTKKYRGHIRWKVRSGNNVWFDLKMSCPNNNSTPGYARCTQLKTVKTCSCWRPINLFSTGSANIISRLFHKHCMIWVRVQTPSLSWR